MTMQGRPPRDGDSMVAWYSANATPDLPEAQSARVFALMAEVDRGRARSAEQYAAARPAARRLRLRWAAFVETPWSAMMGRFQGVGGMEMGGWRRQRVGSAWTRRGALRLAERKIRTEEADHGR